MIDRRRGLCQGIGVSQCLKPGARVTRPSPFGLGLAGSIPSGLTTNYCVDPNIALQHE